MTDNSLKEQIEAFAPLVISIILLINTYLAAKGLPCIEIADQTVTTVISGIASIASIIYNWWKNNNVTEKSKVSQEVLDCMKDGIVDSEDVLDFLNEKIVEGYEYDSDEVKEEVKEAVNRSEEIDDNLGTKE